MIRRAWRRFYGADWRRYRLVLIARARNRCAHCGREFPSPRLAAAHITHDPRSSEVRVLCFSCHARWDARHAYSVKRRNRARLNRQLWLWPELAWAPFPAWMRPREREEQGRLFG